MPGKSNIRSIPKQKKVRQMVHKSHYHDGKDERQMAREEMHVGTLEISKPPTPFEQSLMRRTRSLHRIPQRKPPLQARPLARHLPLDQSDIAAPRSTLAPAADERRWLSARVRRLAGFECVGGKACL